jgi:DnaK suppressor protein
VDRVLNGNGSIPERQEREMELLGAHWSLNNQLPPFGTKIAQVRSRYEGLGGKPGPPDGGRQLWFGGNFFAGFSSTLIPIREDETKPEKTHKYRLKKEMHKMNKTDLEKYKAMLLTRQAELSKGLANREDIAIQKTPDALDEVQLAGERELAIRNLDRESNLLRNVKAALMRINDGSYGICMHCEEEIKPKRLEAVPWTPYCIRCQEAHDRHEFESPESLDELLANAA